MVSFKESPLFYGFSFIVVLDTEFDKNTIENCKFHLI